VSGVAAPATAATTSLTIATGSTKTVDLSTTSSVDGTASATYALPALPKSGNGFYGGVRLRSTSAGAYSLATKVAPNGTIEASLKRQNGSTTTVLTSPVTLATKASAGKPVGLTLTASGTNPVTLTGKITVHGYGPRTITASDSAASRITTAGKADATAYVSSTTPAMTVSVASGTTPPVTAAPAPTPQPSTGWPNATNTGVPAGTKLTVHDGNLVVNEANAVISGLEIRGTVTINAPGVVIKNSKIVGGSTAGSLGLINNFESKASFTIVDSEIYAATPSIKWNGIFGSNFTAERVNVHGVVDSVKVLGSNVTIRDSWLHGNTHYASGDAYQNGGATHDDSIQIQAGTNLLFEGNRIEDATNAGIQITQDTSRTTLGSITLRDNYLQGGSCTVNIAKTPAVVKPTLTGNTFGPERKSKPCAVIAPNANAPKLTGNVWEATGKAMTSFIVVP
jgi:hypothetical protein